MTASPRLDPLAGQQHPGARLTDEDCRLILELHAAGLSFAVIANKFECSKGCIAKVVSGQRRSYLLDVDERLLAPRRKAPDLLPQMPPVVLGQCAGDRAMVLMVAVLALSKDPST